MSENSNKYHDFVPKNIFKKDRQNNDVYFQWGEYGNGYIVNDSIKRARLVDLEGYKYFFVSYKAPVFIPLLVFALIISVGLSFFIESTVITFEEILIHCVWILYVIILFIYFMKIRNVTRGCDKISKDEKDWIFRKEFV